MPHDWAIEGPFDPRGEAGSGKLPWKGVGYYRKTLVLDKAPKGRRVFLDFDGVMCDARGCRGIRADGALYGGAG